MKPLFFISLFFCLLQHSAGATVWYVTSDGAGTKDGTSWANACGDIQQMINGAAAGDEVWVAEGKYPSNYRVTDLAYVPGGATNAFLLKKDVKLYGGFSGTETALSQRNWALYKSTMAANGAYHVVIAAGDVGTALLDGFTIASGNSNNSNSMVVNGQTVNNSYGAGIHIANASPQIMNCNISYNQSTSTGSGLYITGASSAPVFTNCVFYSNTDNNGHCIQLGNSSLTLINSVVHGNSMGALFNGGSANVYNSIIFGALGGQGALTQQYSLIEGFSNTTNGNLDGTSTANSDANIFNDPGALDFTLKTGSNAIDAGSNALVPTAAIQDLAHNGRIFNTTVDMGPYEYGSVPLPVVFSNIQAVFKANQLSVCWTTLSETNCSHFIIEGSKDGTAFSSLQEIKSKALNGNSSVPINYTWNQPAISVGYFSLFLIAIFSLARFRFAKRNIFLLSVFAAFVLLQAVACKKATIETNKNSPCYMRIAQVDKGGKQQYSKIIKVINE